MIAYRRSTEADLEYVRELISERFGNRDYFEPYKDLNGRYLLAFDGDRCIAMTGLEKLGTRRYEVDWTCVCYDYEGQGLITNMICALCKTVPAGSTVICSCWRLRPDSNISLYHSMRELGFTLLKAGDKEWHSERDRWCPTCVEHSGEHCTCREDLYIRQL